MKKRKGFDYMFVLVACEESQRVCSEFRNLGHIAFSCDILDCSGGHPEWHIKGDVIPLLDGFCGFYTQDNIFHYIDGEWDLIIAHPPCTYLTVTGNRWFNISKYGFNAIQRYANRKKAIEFFMKFVNANCDRIVIENPIGCMSTYYRKPDQIIQPFQFGDSARKSTCLWLKNLPNLIPTNVVKPDIIKYKNGKGSDNPWHFDSISLPPAERSRFRSKTFLGIAKAMASQWGGNLLF